MCSSRRNGARRVARRASSGSSARPDAIPTSGATKAGGIESSEALRVGHVENRSRQLFLDRTAEKTTLMAVRCSLPSRQCASRPGAVPRPRKSMPSSTVVGAKSSSWSERTIADSVMKRGTAPDTRGSRSRTVRNGYRLITSGGRATRRRCRDAPEAEARAATTIDLMGPWMPRYSAARKCNLAENNVSVRPASRPSTLMRTGSGPPYSCGAMTTWWP